MQVTDSSAFAAPVILWNGTEYAAFWLDVTPEELARLFFARFSPAGTEIDRVMLISDMVDRVKNFTAVWTGADHGILWSQGESTGADLYLQRMTPGGELYGSRIQIPTSISPERLQLVWNGHELGMTWSEKTPEGDDGRVKVYFARVGFCD